MDDSKQTIIDTFQMIAEGKMTNAHFSNDGVVMVSKEHYAALFAPGDVLAIIDSVGNDGGGEWDRAVAAVRQAFEHTFRDQVASDDGKVEMVQTGDQK